MQKKKTRSKTTEETIAISGAAGNFGGLLTRRLHRTSNIVTIDPRSFDQKPKDVKHHQTELARRDCRDLFRKRKITTVIHLGPHHLDHRYGTNRFIKAIENFNKLLSYCDSYGIQKLVLLSSADVYGARPNNPQFLTEESPLLAADLSALRDVDMMAQSFFWKRPDIETVILRPAHIVGNVSSTMMRFLRLSPLPKPMGYDPMLQLIHEEDVISAIKLALTKGKRGVFNLAGKSPLPLSRIIKNLGRSTVPIPHTVAKTIMGYLHTIDKNSINPAYINYLRFVCMVDDTRAKETLGYQSKKSLSETMAAINLWKLPD